MSEQSPIPMPSLEIIQRRDRDLMIRELAKANAENAKLRAALQEIFDLKMRYVVEARRYQMAVDIAGDALAK